MDDPEKPEAGRLDFGSTTSPLEAEIGNIHTRQGGCELLCTPWKHHFGRVGLKLTAPGNPSAVQFALICIAGMSLQQ